MMVIDDLIEIERTFSPIEIPEPRTAQARQDGGSAARMPERQDARPESIRAACACGICGAAFRPGEPTRHVSEFGRVHDDCWFSACFHEGV
jgi:hypothetical protein